MGSLYKDIAEKLDCEPTKAEILSEIKQLFDSISSLTKHRAELEDELQTLTQEHEDRGKIMTGLGNRVKDLELANKNLTTSDKAKDARIRDLEEDVTHRNSDIEHLESQREKLEETVCQLSAEVDELLKEKESYDAEIGRLDNELTGVRTDLNSKTQEANALAVDREDLKRDVEVASSSLTSTEKELSKLRARFEHVHMLAYEPLFKIIWRRIRILFTTKR